MCKKGLHENPPHTGRCAPCRAAYDHERHLASDGNENRAKSARWRDKNRDKLRENNRRYRATHVEQRTESYRKWAAANPEKRTRNNERRIYVGGVYMGSLSLEDSGGSTI